MIERGSRWKAAVVGAAALAWGGVWALFLQRHPVGRWLAVRRTWLTVVVGVGVDLLLVLVLVPFRVWLRAAAIIGLSGVGIVGRSLWNEWGYGQAVLGEVASRGVMGDGGKGIGE